MPTTASVLTIRPRRMPITCTTSTMSEARTLTSTTQTDMTLPSNFDETIECSRASKGPEVELDVKGFRPRVAA